MTEVKKDLRNKMIVKYKTNMVKHPYLIIVEIQDLDWQWK